MTPITQIFSIRGATTLTADTQEEVVKKTTELMAEIARRNGCLDRPDVTVVHIQITTTPDIRSFYPARAIRESGVAPFAGAPLFSALEPPIAGGLPLCVRVMLTVTRAGGEAIEPRHIYLGGASALRPDLAQA
ncbi:MAG: chorismate mutase [Clostridiales bacterium]|jgi:chorismate mutase|nr:chorismate mutase [Clostridiales bacterium]